MGITYRFTAFTFVSKDTPTPVLAGLDELSRGMHEGAHLERRSVDERLDVLVFETGTNPSAGTWIKEHAEIEAEVSAISQELCSLGAGSTTFTYCDGDPVVVSRENPTGRPLVLGWSPSWSRGWTPAELVFVTSAGLYLCAGAPGSSEELTGLDELRPVAHAFTDIDGEPRICYTEESEIYSELWSASPGEEFASMVLTPKVLLSL